MRNISKTKVDIDLSQDRLVVIKEFFNKVFVDENGIEEEIIQAFVERIMVQGNDEIEVRYNGLLSKPSNEECL